MSAVTTASKLLSDNRRADVIRGSAVWGAATLVARVTGFARDILLASSFGTSAAASALVVAQSVPNVARSLISDEVARGTIVPSIAPLLNAGAAAEAAALVRRLALIVAAGMGVVSLAVAAGSTGLVALLTDGDEYTALAAELMRVLAPTIVVGALGSLASAWLVTTRHFALAAWALTAVNLPVIAGLLLVPEMDITDVAWLVLAGVVLQSALLGAAARGARRGVARVPRGQIRGLLIFGFPVVLAFGAASFSGVVDVAFATMAGTEAPAALDRALRLALIPYAVIAMAVAVVALPLLTEAAVRSRVLLRDEIVASTRLVLALLLPVALFMLVCAEPLVRVVYERGEFDASSTAITSDALRGFAIALPALGLSLLGARAWLAQRRAVVPAVAAVAAVILNAALDWLLVGPLGVFGIALATAIAHGTTGSILLVAATRPVPLLDRPFVAWALRLAFAILAPTGAAILVAILTSLSLSDLGVLLSGCILLAIAAGLATRLGVDEYASVAKAIRRRA